MLNCQKPGLYSPNSDLIAKKGLYNQIGCGAGIFAPIITNGKAPSHSTCYHIETIGGIYIP